MRGRTSSALCLAYTKVYFLLKRSGFPALFIFCNINTININIYFSERHRRKILGDLKGAKPLLFNSKFLIFFTFQMCLNLGFECFLHW